MTRFPFDRLAVALNEAVTVPAVARTAGQRDIRLRSRTRNVIAAEVDRSSNRPDRVGRGLRGRMTPAHTGLVILRRKQPASHGVVLAPPEAVRAGAEFDHVGCSSAPVIFASIASIAMTRFEPEGGMASRAKRRPLSFTWP